MVTDREAVQELDARLKEERKHAGEKVGILLFQLFLKIILNLKTLDPFGTEKKKKVHRFTNDL